MGDASKSQVDQESLVRAENRCGDEIALCLIRYARSDVGSWPVCFRYEVAAAGIGIVVIAEETAAAGGCIVLNRNTRC